jgi:hypothetical protein
MKLSVRVSVVIYAKLRMPDIHSCILFHIGVLEYTPPEGEYNFPVLLDG